jgi:hypothetical protein
MRNKELPEPRYVRFAESHYIKPTKNCSNGGQNPDSTIISIRLEAVHLVAVSKHYLLPHKQTYRGQRGGPSRLRYVDRMSRVCRNPRQPKDKQQYILLGYIRGVEYR